MVEEAKRIIACKSCAWNRFCILPPEFTSDELERRKEKIKQEANTMGAEEQFFASVLTTLVLSGRDQVCPACPVFIERLQKSDALIKRIKEMMQGWSNG